MRKRFALGLLLLMAALANLGAQTTVPPLHSTSLGGQRVDLPEALKGKIGVLVIGFSQTSRGQVTAWGKKLAAEYRDSPGVVYYEMAMLTSVPKPLRGWVLKKIAANVPDVAKSRFVAILDHEPEWKACADYGNADDAYVLVVDGGGVVRYEAKGPMSDGTGSEIKKRVESLRTR